MTAYSLYDERGHVTETCDVPHEILLMNLGDNAGYVEGRYPPEEYYIDPDTRLPVVKAPKPGPLAEYDYGTRQWVAKPVEELAQAKATALTQITRMRGQARLAYITDLPGQDMLLTAKLEEARAYVGDTHPDPTEYPLIMSEVGVTAQAPDEVAQVFLNLNALWRAAAGSLDAACFQAKAAVEEAPDETTVQNIVGSLQNALL